MPFPGSRRSAVLPPMAALLLVAWLPLSSSSAPMRAERPEAEENSGVLIPGSVPPSARVEFDRGPADPDAPMDRMIFPLKVRSGAEGEIEALLTRQQDPSSPDYHRWLTPEDFGRRFGLPDDSVAEVVAWLSDQGFHVESVANGRGWIVFSGTAGHVEKAFATQIRRFDVRGELHQSNATEISLPSRIARWLGGPIPMHDFRTQPLHRRMPAPPNPRPESPAPLYNSGGVHYLAPADFSKVYNVDPAASTGRTGSGVKIAVPARTNIRIGDVRQFRSFFGLPPNDPVIIVNGRDPGILNADEEGEAQLDLEWAGAVAPGAEIDLVVTADTSTTDGVIDSSRYIVDRNVAPIVTVSFGLCEMFPETMLFNSLWNQAAAQGISVFVASGDTGAAGCEDANATTARRGAWVNGLGSTPWNTCVGGTQFLDTESPSTYWGPTNDPVTKGSALSYIPEKVWNESGGPCGALCASGGGASVFYPRPSWQIGPGVPSDASHRYLPDVSLSAGTHDAYLTFVNGSSSLTGFGGTSVSSPAFAGIMALIVQTFGPQGNPNPRLYQIGAAQFGSAGPSVFHDVTQGDNSVPGQVGFPAGPGYDQATGWGSVDVAALVANWAAAPPPSAQRTPPIKPSAPGRGARTIGFH